MVEQVVAVGVRHRCNRLADAIRVNIADKRHRDAGDSVLARVLDPVAVGVKPDRVADQPCPLVPKVLVEVVFAFSQRHVRRVVERPVRIAGLRQPRRQRPRIHRHRVVSRRKVVEQVVAVGVRRRVRRVVHSPIAVKISLEDHDHARDPVLAHVLNPVAVGVEPDRISDRAVAWIGGVSAAVVGTIALTDNAFCIGCSRVAAVPIGAVRRIREAHLGACSCRKTEWRTRKQKAAAGARKLDPDIRSIAATDVLDSDVDHGSSRPTVN